MPDQGGLILGQISHCTKQTSSKVPGRGAWAVLKLTGTQSTRGLADKKVTNCTQCHAGFIHRVGGKARESCIGFT